MIPKTASDNVSADVSGSGEQLLRNVSPKEKIRLAYKAPEYVVTEVHMDFALAFEKTTVTTELTCNRSTGTLGTPDLILNGQDIQLISVAVDGKRLLMDSDSDCPPEAFIEINSGHNLVISGRLLPAKTEKFIVKTVVEIRPNANLSLMGMYKSDDLIVTQCEAEGFRRITFMVDRPDVMAVYTVRLTANKLRFPVLLSNGNKVESGDLSDGRQFVVYKDPHPKPCYLFAVVAGDLNCLSEVYQHPTNIKVPKTEVNIYSKQTDTSRLRWAMEAIKLAMTWDADTYGLYYDLDVFNIVAVRDFNMGAMENKSLNIFVSSLILASPETSTDLDYERILAVVAHEYFHNWTGNRITLRDWFQLTLKEGLTVYRDHTFSQDMGSAAVKRIEAVQGMRSHQFQEDQGPMSHPIRPESYIAMDNFYTSTVYEKGCEVIRMYHTILGKEGFRKGMDLYVQRYDGCAVTCDDFRGAMGDANNIDFTQFERWYLQAGTPTVTVLAGKFCGSERTFTIRLRQHTPPTPKQTEKLPLHIPVLVSLIGRVSKTEIVPERVLNFTKVEQEFVLEDVVEDSILSIFRGWSAPVNVKIDECLQSFEDLLVLMGHDSDPFNRWESGQKVLTKILLERTDMIRGNSSDLDFYLDTRFVEALRNILQDPTLDGSFKAYCLTAPSEDTIATCCQPYDPIAVHTARESVRCQIRDALQPEFQAMYKNLTKELEGKPYEVIPAAENIAPRQLRNACLAYLTMSKGASASMLAYEHFSKATNMTDKSAAFRALVDIPGPERDAAIMEFYNSANGDPLILDKWFMIRAGADIPNALEEVKSLMEHPEFTLKTPSRMRAVVWRFVMNHHHFHAPGGEGYKFLADIVLQLDDFNPQMAARTATMMADWRKYDPKRGSLIKAELERIRDTSKVLKPDTFEIVNKALA